jgi:hypothetical protein
MGELGYDIRQAWRTIARAPLLTAFVVVLMALSIGSTTAVFSVVNAVLLRPFPFAQPDRLVMVWSAAARTTRAYRRRPRVPEWKARSRSFERMAAIAFDRSIS